MTGTTDLTAPFTFPPLAMEARVSGAALLAADIYGITLAAAPAFKAGQYLMMSIAGLPAKPFSIASAPGLPQLEFHIRDTGQGPGSGALRSLKTGDSVRISLPAGQAYLRQENRPLLALAGGMGITPLKSILEAHLAGPETRPAASLYWAAQKGEGIYLDALFHQRRLDHSGFSYVPLATEDPASLPAALQRDFKTLEGFDIYLSGPRAMVGGMLPLLAARGAKRERIFGDGVEVPP